VVRCHISIHPILGGKRAKEVTQITKEEWEKLGGLRAPNLWRKLDNDGLYTYWRLF
jgi:hypothetical protein